MNAVKGEIEDDRQWLRDALLIEADQWVADVFGKAHVRQLQEMKRAAADVTWLATDPALTNVEKKQLKRAAEALRAAMKRIEAG
jgi:hypothetical protein